MYTHSGRKGTAKITSKRCKAALAHTSGSDDALRNVTPPPCIDLGGVVQIIDETVTPPRWRTLARIFATTENAKRVAREYGLTGVWLRDDTGDRRYITL